MRRDFLRPLYEGTGDHASVYLDASRTSEDAAELVALRWPWAPGSSPPSSSSSSWNCR